MTDVEIGYLAGIIDGEGWMSAAGRGVQLRVNMTDKDAIYRLQTFTGVGSITEILRKGYKTSWEWRVTNSADCLTVLSQVFPYLCERRQSRASEVLSRIEEITGPKLCVRCDQFYTGPHQKRFYCSKSCQDAEMADRKRDKRRLGKGSP